MGWYLSMMQTFKKVSKGLVGIAAGVLLASSVQAVTPVSIKPVPITMCAFMLLGEAGPEYQALIDYKTQALGWGVDLTLKTYMNERVAMEELKAGVCDIANMTSIQARNFNRFTGTLDAPGAMPTYEHLKIVLSTLAKPSAAKYMRVGEYEIIGIQAAGAVFLFTNDRSVSSLAQLAGKKITILDSMPEMRQLVIDLGMTPVSSTLTNMFQKFNNRAADITAGPAIVYDMMELEKGLSPDGGILDRPLVQANIQFVARWEKLPEGFAQKSREFFAANFEQSLKIIRNAENNIPKKWWIPLPEKNEEEYNSLIRAVRLSFRDAGIYEPKTLTLLRKVRCKVDATRAECTSKHAE